MKHGVRRTVSVALGIVLLLGVGAAPAAAEETFPIGDQGGKVCDRTPGDGEGYTGESASKTYDQRFSTLGEHWNLIPDLGTPEKPGWIPQGLAYWPDWDGGKDDLLLVAAYKGGSEARIHGINTATGEFVGTVRIAESHVGGMVVHGDYAYVSAKGSRKVRHYPLSDLRKRLKEDDTSTPETPYLPLEVKPTKISFGVAFLGTDGSTLYAGRYDREHLSVIIMDSYKFTDDGDGGLEPLNVSYRVPVGTQGMTVADGKFVFSASPTHWEKVDGNWEEEPGLRSYLYVMNSSDMEANRFLGTYEPMSKATECFRAPSMSEGMATFGDKSYLVFESGAGAYRDDPDNPKKNPPENEIFHVHVGRLGSGDGDDGDGPGGSTTKYTGPTEADFHDSFPASARLTGGSGAVSGARLSFTLGNGGGSQHCGATTNGSGEAKCRLTPAQAPGSTSMTVRFAGGSGLKPSSDTVPFTITRQETALKYAGPKRIANGTPARLSGVLTEESTDGAAVSGRRVSLALGRGDDRQACTGTTDEGGKAACTIESVDQPLNDDATVPVTVEFEGDTYYEPSRKRATVLLEYYTGRSYGVAADVKVAGLGAGVEPGPDTGPVRTARASRHDPGCSAGVRTLLLRTGTLCPKVVTSLAPGRSRATSAVQDATIGLPGLPVIEVEGATARSASTCASGGSARGTTDMRLRVGGKPVEVTGEPNAEVNLPGAARLVVNEQLPVPGADHGRTVNAVHLTAANRAVDVVIASATSDVHNCAG
jgi:hypothetical protein